MRSSAVLIFDQRYHCGLRAARPGSRLGVVSFGYRKNQPSMTPGSGSTEKIQLLGHLCEKTACVVSSLYESGEQSIG